MVYTGSLEDASVTLHPCVLIHNLMAGFSKKKVLDYVGKILVIVVMVIPGESTEVVVSKGNKVTVKVEQLLPLSSVLVKVLDLGSFRAFSGDSIFPFSVKIVHSCLGGSSKPNLERDAGQYMVI